MTQDIIKVIASHKRPPWLRTNGVFTELTLITTAQPTTLVGNLTELQRFEASLIVPNLKGLKIIPLQKCYQIARPKIPRDREYKYRSLIKVSGF